MTKQTTGEIFPPRKGKLTDIAGAMMGVSGRSVRSMKRVLSLHPELEPYIWAGTCTLQDAKLLCELTQESYEQDMFCLLREGNISLFKENIKTLRAYKKLLKEREVERLPLLRSTSSEQGK